ncbi:hypothetical protein [Xenorhabdus thailandensis]|uniref:hypothetical protein n=1 Tax=Xenorhabdus thailandensis TaxID=3136255 RepID=UPI0030F42924
MYSTVDPNILNIFLRYMINAARNKKLVTYYELQCIFGFSRKTVGKYAGCLGHFCYENKYPLLNSLIVNIDNPKPSYGYDEWMSQAGVEVNWDDEAFNCFKYYHVTSTNAKYFKHFTGMKKEVMDWFG